MLLKSWVKWICSWHRRAETASPKVYLSGRGGANMIHMYRCVWLLRGMIDSLGLPKVPVWQDRMRAMTLPLPISCSYLPQYPSVTQKTCKGTQTLTRHSWPSGKQTDFVKKAIPLTIYLVIKANNTPGWTKKKKKCNVFSIYFSEVTS